MINNGKYFCRYAVSIDIRLKGIDSVCYILFRQLIEALDAKMRSCASAFHSLSQWLIKRTENA